MSAQRAAAATPPATAAAPARAAAVPARAAALAVRGGGAGRRGGCSFGMVMVEAARRGKQLGEVHGFAAAAVEFVDLGTAAESVGEDHRARLGFPQPGAAGRACAGFANLAVADLEAGAAGEAAAAGLQVLGLGAGRGQKLLVRVPAEHGVLVAVHLGEHRRPPLAAGRPIPTSPRAARWPARPAIPTPPGPAPAPP